MNRYVTGKDGQMANKHIKRGSTKCKLKPQCDITTHLSERLAGSVLGFFFFLIVVRPDAHRMWRKRITSIGWWGWKVARPLWKPVGSIYKTKWEMLIDPSSCTLEHLPQRNENSCSHENLYVTMYNSFDPNNKKLGTKQMTFNG